MFVDYSCFSRLQMVCLPFGAEVLFVNLFVVEVTAYPQVQASHQEIAAGQYPQGNILTCRGLQRGSHRVDMQESVHTPCIGNKVTQVPPCIRKHLLRPTNAGYEHKDQRRRDQQYHSALTVADEHAYAHREEDYRQQVWHKQFQDCYRIAYMRQTEQSRHTEQH